MRINRRAAAALTLIAAISLSQAAAVSASAIDYPIQWQEPSSTVIEYGEYWQFTATYPDFIVPSDYDVESTGTPSSFTPDVTRYCSMLCSVSVSAPYDAAVLPAGAYSFTASYDYPGGGEPSEFAATTATSATLTVNPAKLNIELRVISDASTGDGAIVTARFTGRFVDEYSSSFFPGVAQSPAGIWTITIKDEDGEEAISRSVERAAGDDVLATSFYWADAEPGEQYTASASFTPSGVSANNFSIGAAQDFDYTAPTAQRPVPTSAATEKPDASLPDATGFGLPLWALIGIIVLIVGLGVLVTILSVRLSRRPSTRAGEVAA